MPGVTISASFGAGGSVIAPEVAARLGLSYMDRAISSRVAEQLGVSVAEADAGAVNRSLVDRVLHSLAPLSDGAFGVADRWLTFAFDAGRVVVREEGKIVASASRN